MAKRKSTKSKSTGGPSDNLSQPEIKEEITGIPKEDKPRTKGEKINAKIKGDL